MCLKAIMMTGKDGMKEIDYSIFLDFLLRD
jgi:hypothetical protein